MALATLWDSSFVGEKHGEGNPEIIALHGWGILLRRWRDTHPQCWWDTPLVAGWLFAWLRDTPSA